MPLGTIVNILAVIAGSLLGVFLHKHFPHKIKEIVFQSIGIATLVIGVQMALNVKDILAFIFSLLIGGIIGEWMDIEKYTNKLAEKIKSRFNESESMFAEGMITATLIFCIGSMSIIGSINEGLRGDHSLLFAKSILDGFTSIVLASTYGIGVLFSFIPLGLYQGGITILAETSKAFFSQIMIAQLTAVGGALIIGLGINLLDIKRVKVINMLPSLVIVAIFTYLFK